jgi:hypothetical protein
MELDGVVYYESNIIVIFQHAVRTASASATFHLGRLDEPYMRRTDLL